MNYACTVFRAPIKFGIIVQVPASHHKACNVAAITLEDATHAILSAVRIIVSLIKRLDAQMTRPDGLPTI